MVGHVVRAGGVTVDIGGAGDEVKLARSANVAVTPGGHESVRQAKGADELAGIAAAGDREGRVEIVVFQEAEDASGAVVLADLAAAARAQIVELRRLARHAIGAD